MHVLVSNDDGFRAEGIQALAAELREGGVGDSLRVSVVAPDRNRSGASNSLTLEYPLHVREEGEGVYSVDGTPTDCVHLAVTGFLADEPDMVVSGVNHGANLGDDVLYSGTVAAAMEGRFLGLPAVAVSLVSDRPTHFDTAARVAREILQHLLRDPLPPDTILNVNVPDMPWEALRGFKSTRLGHRHKAEPVVPSEDPKGRRLYWIGPPGPEQDAGPDTDFHAVSEGYVSVTPLTIDLTRQDAREQVTGWLEGLPA
ncbi:MAG: 5'/3'-nucleotidase SurE [Gammaproteobacteria bacterium]|nr:5'/3'-nucleotidase SurE [Gammaproteobacteria bacterium]